MNDVVGHRRASPRAANRTATGVNKTQLTRADLRADLSARFM
ncbi:hypothetical protein [Nocardia africana]|uniref:Uncharacterized protein n=1 Tax=Nocardia africana TaxID=134964 RepID=A0ABW6NUD8_9NOCA